jgi:hypothetical protein
MRVHQHATSLHCKEHERALHLIGGNNNEIMEFNLASNVTTKAPQPYYVEPLALALLSMDNLQAQ